jgi:multidrug efflux system membrane fusion protein
MKKFILFAATICLVGCTKKETTPANFTPPAIPVRTAAIEKRTVPLFFESLGVIQPFQSVAVVPQVSGIIGQVHFTEGAWVNAGDLLYTIVDDSLAKKVDEMQAILLQNQAILANAQKKLKRYKSLSSSNLVSQVEWDEVEMQVAFCEATVAADRARLDLALLDLAHCRITAPISGYTSKSELQVGDRTDGSTLVTLFQPEPYQVDFTITEKELEKLPGTALHVAVYSSGGETLLGKGEVIFLDNQLDRKSGLLQASAEISSLVHPVWAGQTVRVHLFFGEKKDAVLIPLKAIKTNQNGSYVFALKEDSTVEIVPVTLGPEEKGWIVVEEGLSELSKVVIEGHNRLFPGSKIEEVR